MERRWIVISASFGAGERRASRLKVGETEILVQAVYCYCGYPLAAPLLLLLPVPPIFPSWYASNSLEPDCAPPNLDRPSPQAISSPELNCSREVSATPIRKSSSSSPVRSSAEDSSVGRRLRARRGWFGEGFESTGRGGGLTKGLRNIRMKRMSWMIARKRLKQPICSQRGRSTFASSSAKSLRRTTRGPMRNQAYFDGQSTVQPRLKTVSGLSALTLKYRTMRRAEAASELNWSRKMSRMSWIGS